MEAITECAGAAMGGVQYEECEWCEGNGEVPCDPSPSDRECWVECPRCGGTGDRVTPKTEPLAILGPGGDYTTEIRE